MQDKDKPGSAEKWWFDSVVYHIYLRSFYDSDGDGIGDLEGVIEKLDYLAGKPDSLSVNAIWISPFYPSPHIDYGYDVSDYCAIDPLFGEMEVFERLLSEAHQRGLKVLIDLIPNHTSDQHQWFKQSAASRENPKRDWYVWADGREGKEPNNWKSVFGGPAWTFHKPTGQYYLHSFAPQQPDLNWDNPAVRAEMAKVAGFWFDKGVDGLRLDAINWISKDPQLRDDPLNHANGSADDPYHRLKHSHSSWGPHLFEYLSELVEVCAKYGNRFMVTEGYPDVITSTGQETAYYLQFYKNLDYRFCAPFNFELIGTEWDAGTYRALIDRFLEALLPGQPAIYTLGNHDKSRLASRLGPEAARAAATMLLSLPGMPFIYYGEEIGMTDVPIAAAQANDPQSRSGEINREIARTPMQWSAGQAAGFSTGRPWLPTPADVPPVNVITEQNDKSSTLNLYKSLLRLRDSFTALQAGTFELAELGRDILAYHRIKDSGKILVVLNFSGESRPLESKLIFGKLLLSSYMDDHQPAALEHKVELRPFEGLIVEISA